MRTKLRTRMNATTILCLLLILIVDPNLACASEARVVVGAVGVSASDLKAFATSKEALPYSEYLEANRPGLEFDAELKSRFARAQKAWLSGQTEDARTSFRALTELVLKADWRLPQREVLLTSFMRLAQSSLSGTEKTSWIESAVKSFSDLEPLESLFPPPLIEEFRAARIRMLENAASVEPWVVFPEARFVLIDGRKIETTQRKPIILPAGVHRVTALSDTHGSFTEFLTPNQLRLFRAKPMALSEGSCARARIQSSQTLSLNPILFVGAHCDSGPQQLELKPQLLSTQMMGDLHQPKVATKNRTWIWVVGGAVLAGAGYAIARELNKDKSSDQVHRSGF